jgi:hypothetical protein
MASLHDLSYIQAFSGEISSLAWIHGIAADRSGDALTWVRYVRSVTQC